MNTEMTMDEIHRDLGVARLPETCCGRCQNWTRKNPDDLSAPEGTCGLSEYAGHWPGRYWPNTLQRDKCRGFTAVSGVQGATK